MAKSILEKLRQPEYTGDNRCGPCTALNVGIAALLGALLSRKSNIAGLLVTAASIVVIYLRGYLVPGTPALTKRYLSPTVLRWFGKEPELAVASGLDTGSDQEIDTDSSSENLEDGTANDNQASSDAPTETIDLETYFLDRDVLEPCSDADDLCLTNEFEARWLEECESLTETELSATAVAEALGFADDSRTFELVVHGDTHRLRSERKQVGRWPSRSALVADIAANRIFRTWVSDWDAYAPDEKGKLLNSLRMFLETCPTAEGDVQMSEEVIESCCRSQNVITVTCEATGERLFVHRSDNVDG